jgi:hypothetical protein
VGHHWKLPRVHVYAAGRRLGDGDDAGSAETVAMEGNYGADPAPSSARFNSW